MPYGNELNKTVRFSFHYCFTIVPPFNKDFLDPYASLPSPPQSMSVSPAVLAWLARVTNTLTDILTPHRPDMRSINPHLAPLAVLLMRSNNDTTVRSIIVTF